MKQALLGLILLANTLSAYSQNCGQASALIKVRAEVGKIVQTLNPINSTVLDNSGEMKDVFYDLPNRSLISQSFKNSIDQFYDNKVDITDLKTHLTYYTSKSLKECIKADELLIVVDSLEKASTAAPHYKTFAKEMTKELAVQKHYIDIITQDIKAIQSKGATKDQITSFLEKYQGNTLEIAMYHAKDYLIEVKSNVSTLAELSESLETDKLDASFDDIKNSVNLAIEKTFEAIELSGI